MSFLLSFLLLFSSVSLTEYGYGNVKSVLISHQKMGEVQVSFLDKNGWCRGNPKEPWEKFIHPGWMHENLYDIENVDEMIKILKTLPENSIDIIYYGSHGKDGKAKIGEQDVIVNEEAKQLLKSKLKKNGWFILTGCNLGKFDKIMVDLSLEIDHPVVAATGNTDNDLDVSLWVAGVWKIFFPSMQQRINYCSNVIFTLS